MAGLSFDDSPMPDPQWLLSRWLDEWIDALGGSSRQTVQGYVNDVAGFAAELCEAVGKAVPGLVRDPEGLRLAAQDETLSLQATSRGYSVVSYLRAFELFDVLVLADLAPRNLARALVRYRASHADNSARRAAAAWSSFCRYLVGQQILAANPMQAEAVRRPKEVEGDPTPLTRAELERLFETVQRPDPRARHPWPERDLAAAAIFVSTGVRLSEAIGAAVGDFVDETETGARLRVLGKGNKRRTIPVHEEAALAIRTYLADRARLLGTPGPNDPLLVRFDNTAFTPPAMRRLVESWYTRAAIRRHPGASVHALRHSFGTHALDAGASAVEVQQLMGHASLSTTQRYLAVVGKGLEEAIAKHPTRHLLGVPRHSGQHPGAGSGGEIRPVAGP